MQKSAGPLHPSIPHISSLRLFVHRRPHASVALPGSLHPSCGHFQSPLIGLRSRARDFSLEGLCPRRRARSDDTDSDGVLAPLLSARAAQGFRAHPSLRLSGESLSSFPPSVEPTTSGSEQRNRRASWNL